MSKNGKTFREKELLLEVARSIVKRYGFFSFLERFQFSRQNKIRKSYRGPKGWGSFIWMVEIHVDRLHLWTLVSMVTKMLSKWIMNYFLNIEWNESRIEGGKSETNNLECKKIVRPWRNFAMGSTSHVLKWLRKPTIRLAHKFKQAYVPEEFPLFE